MAEFKTPEFLQNKSTDNIHKDMLGQLPTDIDTSEGNHVWNLTRPTALVTAEICQFILPEVIKLIFPEWSYGSFLDAHAKTRNISRRAAVAANGFLTITAGDKEITIPAGSLFATASINDEPSVDYETLEEVTIPANESVQVEIQCTQTGIIGNTQAGTIVLVASKLTGVAAVINEAAIMGGTEEEDDETLIGRVEEYDRTQGDSFVGNVSDYRRWATSVDGVGEVTVIPATDDSGLVTIIVTDLNGDPATAGLCENVYNYIMRPDDPPSRLAPVNALLLVKAPDTTPIGVKVIVELDKDVDIEAVKEAFMAQLALYLPVALDEGEVKLTQVGAVLSAIPGVNDYRELQIGAKINGTITYGTTNIPITNTMLPVINEEDLIMESGTVE